MEPKKKKTPVSDIPTVYITAGIIIVTMLTIFGISAFMRVNSIVVDGVVLYSAKQVAEASGISKGDNLLYIGKKNIENKIITQLPYISSVTVNRGFPDTLTLTVKESKAVAYIPYAGNALIIDSSGRILDIFNLTPGAPVELAGTRLIEIRGIPINEAELGKKPQTVQGSESNFNNMSDILNAFERETIDRDVDYLDIANITNISFGYKDRYRVIIGGLRDYSRKISQLQTTVSRLQESNPNSTGIIDMTSPLGDYKFISYDY